MALGGSRGCGGAFLLEVCQQIVRWEASYKAKPFPKNVRNLSQMAWEAPRARPPPAPKLSNGAAMDSNSSNNSLDMKF